VRVGNAAVEIVRCAGDEQVDLIAMSTHGRSGLDRALHGSVAEAVLRTAGRPVLLTRPGPGDFAGQRNDAESGVAALPRPDERQPA